MNEHVGNDRLGVVTAPRTIRIERILPGPVERVWTYLTESDKRKKWLAEGPMANYVGGDVELTFYHSQLSNEPAPADYQKYEGHTNKGKVTRYEPPTLLSFTWPESTGEPSEVTFELTASGSDTLLRVTHTRLGQQRLHGERRQRLAHTSGCPHRSPQRRTDQRLLGQIHPA